MPCARAAARAASSSSRRRFSSASGSTPFVFVLLWGCVVCVSPSHTSTHLSRCCHCLPRHLSAHTHTLICSESLFLRTHTHTPVLVLSVCPNQQLQQQPPPPPTKLLTCAPRPPSHCPASQPLLSRCDQIVDHRHAHALLLLLLCRDTCCVLDVDVLGLLRKKTSDVTSPAPSAPLLPSPSSAQHTHTPHPKHTYLPTSMCRCSSSVASCKSASLNPRILLTRMLGGSSG